MAWQSFNKVFIIGNLTRDPVLKVTPNGASVCTFGVATNSKYRKSDGSIVEIATYIDIVAWSKLAEICAQKLKKGMKVFLEGELRTRRVAVMGSVQGSRNKTEVRIVDMRIIDDRRSQANTSTTEGQISDSSQPDLVNERYDDSNN